MNEPHKLRSRFLYSLAGAGALYALLQLLKSELAVFHLQPPVQALISLTIGTFGLLLTQLREDRRAWEAREAQAQLLDSGMASFTPRAAKELSRHDLGLRRHGGPSEDYVRRDVDAQLSDALRDVGSVVITGPRYCGKTRTALQALDNGDMVLAPENAAGLNSMLSEVHREAIRTLAERREGRTVLWLDDLERFLQDLDLDQLDRFQRPELMPKAAGPYRKTLAWLKRKRPSASATGPGGEDETVGDAELSVQMIATLRDEKLQGIRDDTDPNARVGRRLLARMQGIALTDDLSPGEKTEVGPHHGDPAPSKISELFAEHGSHWQPKMTWRAKSPHPSGRRANFVFWGLALIASGLTVLTILVGNELHWTVPPSNKVQVENLRAALATCQHAVPSSYANLRDEQYLVMAVESQDCPSSSELRYYRRDHGRIEELFAEAPREGGEPWGVSCIGPPERPCHLPIGQSVVVPASFSDPNHNQLLPFILFTSNGTKVPHLEAPYLPPPSRTKSADAAFETHLLSLKLRSGAPVDPRGIPHDPCPDKTSLCGFPAEAIVALPNEPNLHPAVLAAGYLTRGSRGTPKTMHIRAWELLPPAAGRLRIERQLCLILRRGLLNPNTRVRATEPPRIALIRFLRSPATSVVC